jgi:hypothetical protein
MDVDSQRAAVAAARAADPGHFDFAGADSGAAVPFAATLEVTNATIAIYNEDNGKHAVELTQRFARAKAFTHVLLLKSPQEIRPTIDEQKALLLVRFPADFSRNLDTFTAPLQLILDGRNSNSAQIAANYLQQIVKDYQQELMEGKRSRTTASWWCATGTTRIWTTNGSWCRR